MGTFIVKALQLLAKLLEWEYSRLLLKEAKVSDRVTACFQEQEEKLDALYEEYDDALHRLRVERDSKQHRIQSEAQTKAEKLDRRLEDIRKAERVDFQVLTALKPIIKE